jgi:hypothetical protein
VGVTLLGLSIEEFREFAFIILLPTSHCLKILNFSFLGLIVKFGAMDTTDIYDPHRSSYGPILLIFELSLTFVILCKCAKFQVDPTSLKRVILPTDRQTDRQNGSISPGSG